MITQITSSSLCVFGLSGPSDVAFTCLRRWRIFLTPNAPECVGITQQQSDYGPGMILLSVNVKSDYPLRSQGGGGGGGIWEGGVRIPKCWANGFFYRAAGWHQERPLAGRTPEGRLWLLVGTWRATSRRGSWDALSTLPALRPCPPTRPEARTDTTSCPTAAMLMGTAVRG